MALSVVRLLALSLLAGVFSLRCRHCCRAFSIPVPLSSRRGGGVASSSSSSSSSSGSPRNLVLAAEPPRGGISAVVATFEEVVVVVMVVEEEGVVGVVAAAVDSGRRGGDAASATASTSPSMSATKRVGINSRGAKMNEVRPSSAMNETRQIGGGGDLFAIIYTYTFLIRSHKMSSRLISPWLRRTRAFRGATRRARGTTADRRRRRRRPHSYSPPQPPSPLRRRRRRAIR